LDEEEQFLLSRPMMNALMKTLSGRLSDCDLSVLPNAMAIKLLQIQRICKLIESQSSKKSNLMTMEPQFELMLRDGLQSELRMQYQIGDGIDDDDDDRNTKWDRNSYNILILECINRVLYGEEIKSESFLMKTKHEIASRTGTVPSGVMEFDFVTADGLVVNLCVDEKRKRGIMVLGPGDIFINDEERMTAENHINWLLLTEYAQWDLLCLDWKTHGTEREIVDAVKQWMEEEKPRQHLIAGKRRRRYLY